MKATAKTYAAFAIRHDLRTSTDYTVRRILSQRHGYDASRFSRECEFAIWEALGLL